MPDQGVCNMPNVILTCFIIMLNLISCTATPPPSSPKHLIGSNVVPGAVSKADVGSTIYSEFDYLQQDVAVLLRGCTRRYTCSFLPRVSLLTPPLVSSGGGVTRPRETRCWRRQRVQCCYRPHFFPSRAKRTHHAEKTAPSSPLLFR